MMFDLPDPETLYDALLARDASYEGRAFVGVTSTGIFCRLSCPARKPLRENCVFLESPAACLNAGFRACLRCHPLGQIAPEHARLLTALESDPSRRWSEADIVAAGHDPSTLRRAFKRQFGMTFLDMARIARLKAGARALGTGASVIDAQLEAGFDSASGFRAAFARLLGHAPSRMGGNAMLRSDWIDTPLGGMIAVTDQHALHLLEFTGRRALGTELRRLAAMAKGSIGLGRTAITDQTEAQLTQYFAGLSADFTVPMVLHGSPFARAVWARLREIPVGQTRSYGRIAAEIGRPDAVRAVAQANGANQIALMIPCHRVIGANGALTGYGVGIWRKDRLIALETEIAKKALTHDHAI
jgi:AraC family transcriptional regulator, regulatory protein of adaptative response / methylated-DNA-[protein]-cysteine methyltransferase